MPLPMPQHVTDTENPEWFGWACHRPTAGVKVPRTREDMAHLSVA